MTLLTLQYQQAEWKEKRHFEEASEFQISGLDCRKPKKLWQEYVSVGSFHSVKARQRMVTALQAQVQVTSLMRRRSIADLLAKLSKADTEIASLLVRKKSCGQTWLTKERRQLEELVLAENLQNLQSGSQALIKQPRTKGKSTAKIWREELEANILARVGGNGVD